MSKFKVGDRVKLVNPMELGRNFCGRTGTIEYIEKSNQDDLDYAVEFDEESPKFHDCFGHCVKNHGYWCNDEMIDLVEQEPKKEYYNGKIFVVDGDYIFKTGHVYDVDDGLMRIPSGALIPSMGTPFKDIEDIKDYFVGSITGKRKRTHGWSSLTVTVMEVKED